MQELKLFTMTGVVFSALLVLLFSFSTRADADTSLPRPDVGGGTGIYRLLEERASAPRNAFPKGAVSEAELATILWAASGRNRDGGGWTIPLAMGRPPYVRIYALSPEGAYLYLFADHSLREIAKKDVRKQVAKDGFAEAAPWLLLFVADPEILKGLGGEERARGFAYVAAGAMSQNVYLAAGDMGIATRYLATLDAAGAAEALDLPDGAFPICLMPLAKK